MEELKKERHDKTIDELTFTDDGMFQAVLHEPDVCAELVERLLHIKVGKIEYPKLEKTIAPFYSTKGVRLDVYLKDEDKIIDIEIQSYRQDELGKRMRYYQSMIDMDSLMKGQDYPSLKDSYILFICKYDPFIKEKKEGYGRSCYTFKTICLEESGVNLNDKSIKVVYNASAYKAEKDEKARALLHYIHTNEPAEDDFSKRLEDYVKKIKNSEKFRRDYVAMNLHDRDIMRLAKQEGLAEGITQGTQQKAIEAAEKALEMNLTVEQAAEITGLPLEQVLELKKQVTVNA